MLGRDFFARDTVTVARELVGCVLEVDAPDGRASGRIVEVEAYGGAEDPASHAGRGVTPRSAIMFGPPGVAYVYFIYGMHCCLNFVAHAEGAPGAVLVRAVEPLVGRAHMVRRRGLDPARARDRDLAAGPGRLCRALGIDLAWNGLPAAARARGPQGAPGRIRVRRGPPPAGGVAEGVRIGIRRAVDHPHRFLDAASGCLSAPLRGGGPR